MSATVLVLVLYTTLMSGVTVGMLIAMRMRRRRRALDVTATWTCWECRSLALGGPSMLNAESHARLHVAGLTGYGTAPRGSSQQSAARP